jgi:hypothetical protein
LVPFLCNPSFIPQSQHCPNRHCSLELTRIWDWQGGRCSPVTVLGHLGLGHCCLVLSLIKISFWDFFVSILLYRFFYWGPFSFFPKWNPWILSW